MDDRYSIPAAVEEQILALMREGRKIAAIKLLREASGLGLKEAKEAVEQYSLDQGMTRHGAATSPSLVAGDFPSGGREVEMPSHLRSELMALIHGGQKISAIKALREKTGVGLKEAKEAVERLERGERPTVLIMDGDGGPFSDPSGPTTRPGVDLEVLVEETASLVAAGQKLEAIKRWREATGVGLKEAKDEVERIEYQRRPSRPAALRMEPMPGGGGGGPGAEFTDQTALESDIITLLQAGRRDEAVQRYISSTGDNPRRAKQAVKRIAMVNHLKMGRCFIATACYGDPAAAEVMVLRRFRDDRLLRSRAGVWTVRAYYLLSPPLARVIETYPALGRVARELVVGPAASWAARRRPNRSQ